MSSDGKIAWSQGVDFQNQFLYYYDGAAVTNVTALANAENIVMGDGGHLMWTTRVNCPDQNNYHCANLSYYD